MHEIVVVHQIRCVAIRRIRLDQNHVADEATTTTSSSNTILHTDEHVVTIDVWCKCFFLAFLHILTQKSVRWHFFLCIQCHPNLISPLVPLRNMLCPAQRTFCVGAFWKQIRPLRNGHCERMGNRLRGAVMRWDNAAAVCSHECTLMCHKWINSSSNQCLLYRFVLIVV